MAEDCLKLKKSLITQEGIQFNIKYELVLSGKCDKPSYGIAISTYDNYENLDDFVEIKDITENFVEIQSLFMVLYKYEVTPITLYDVLDVYLADSDSLIATLN